jgi:hypothetical protein
MYVALTELVALIAGGLPLLRLVSWPTFCRAHRFGEFLDGRPVFRSPSGSYTGCLEKEDKGSGALLTVVDKEKVPQPGH